jgi:subtilisin-like proprotein convertase family protein
LGELPQADLPVPKPQRFLFVDEEEVQTMLSSKIVRLTLVLAVFGLGAWLLSQTSRLTPETADRHQAVQLALAPARQSVVGEEPVKQEDGPTIVYGQPVKPATVSMAGLPSRPAEKDLMQEAYESGALDMDVNEGPYGAAVFQAMLEESLKQPVDPSIQNYNPQNSLDLLNSGASFKAIDYTQSQQGVPPDPDIMVGKDHIVVGVNTSFQVFDKNGNSLVGPTLYEDFWGANCGSGSNVSMFDPYSQYDEENGRYVLGITAYDPNINGGDNGWACIAVSQTDSATGQWYLYSFDGNPGTGTDYFFDYPHIGIGQDAIYLSANMFGASFVRNHVFAYDKNAMYAGQSANSVKINVGSSNFTLQPAKLKGFLTGGWPTNANEPHYFIDAQYGNNQSTLTVWRFSDPWGTPSFTQAGAVSVASYSLPVAQPQSGGSNIQGNDNRLLDVEYWAGRMWTTHSIGCNPGGGTVNCIRWYEINISSGTPSLVQQGTLATAGQYRSFPDLGVNACGDMLVGYTKTSSTTFPSVYVAGREASDPLGTLKDETLVHAGEAFYTAYDSAPRRWGDYTGMALDPDGRTFWYLGEYSREQATARWSTWVSAHTWPNCNLGPTPTPGPTATATNTPLPTNTPGPVSCTTYNSTNVPLTISSSGTPSISSILSVAGGGVIADVNVRNLNGTHTYFSDLDFNLISPAGTEVQIMAPSCSSTDNFNLNLDDEAAAGSWPCPPTNGGTYQPSNPLSAFDGQNSGGAWTLRIDDNANLDGGSLNGWGLEICTQGAGPTPTNTPVPPTPPNTSVPPTPTNTAVPPTPTNTPVPGSETFYLSTTANGTVGGVAFNDEDIISYNPSTGAVSLYFDGSDVGISGDVNAFVLLSDGSILMSFDATTTAGAAGSVTDADIVQFVPTSLGSTTAGTFSLFFDGSDVGMSASSEDIDALTISNDGKLILSTAGGFSANGASGADEDLFIFTATSFGSATAGSFAIYFDGSDVALNNSSSEDVNAADMGPDGRIYLSTLGAFSVTGASGDGADIFVCNPSSTGANTACSFSLYWDGSANGFSGLSVDDLQIVR